MDSSSGNLVKVRDMVEGLGRIGYRPVTIDRTLRMKIGTTQRWAEGHDVTPEAVALLSILQVYPWLLRVADDGYTPEAVNSAMWNILADSLCQSLAEGKGQAFGVQGPNTRGDPPE